jgi:hypothetical protein
MAGAAPAKARAAGRTSEPQEDRAALVQRRKKQRLQVRAAAADLSIVSCHWFCLLRNLLPAIPAVHRASCSD